MLFESDPNGNLKKLTPPGRPGHGFSYTANDLTASYTPPEAANVGLRTTAYTYDLDGALAQMLLPDAKTIVPEYDSVTGQLVSVTTSRGTTSVTYDAAGRVATVTEPDGGSLAYGYDGFLATSESWTGPVLGSVTWSYDNDFRVSSSTVNGGSSVSYAYDADSLLTRAGALAISREAATGRVSGTTLGNTSTTQSYDPSYGESIDYGASANGSALYGYTLTRDLAGRITGKTETIQGVTDTYMYGFDDAGRLATVTKNGTQVGAYTYDLNGNRLSKATSAGTEAGVYDDQDRMLSTGSATYTYGPNGDLASKTVGTQTTAYDYDSFGALRGVVLPDDRSIEYVIDGRNRRIGKRVNGALVEGFLYDGQLRPAAWLDGTGATKATFVYGLHVNVPEYMVTSAGTYRIVTDHLGSPRLVVDTATGTIAQRMDYDEWGNVVADSNPGFQPFGFAGGLYDRDTGLVRFGFRDYDPGTGRWTNKDPIGFGGGDANVYAYVGNDPVGFIDPDGLEVRVYSSDAFGISGLNHAFVYSTVTGRGKGTNGSSGFTLGDGIADMQSPYRIVSLPFGMSEAEFMNRIKDATGWNNGIWTPWVNDCHSDLGNAFEQAGVPYPGAPGGRVDIDDNARANLDYFARILNSLNNPSNFYRLFGL